MKVLVMGVSGIGKSTVGAALASRLGARFIDADDLHPPENIAAQAAGQPLTDEMRWPWLGACGAALADGGPAVLGCSALKRAYRHRLRRHVPDLSLVYLRADPALVAQRLAVRKNHFMDASLLDSQFATLQPPGPDENPITVDVAGKVDTIVAAILRQLDP